MDDSRIIELFLERDEQAIREVTEKYGAYIYKIAVNILGNHEDTEECVYESLLKTWNTIPPNRTKKLPVYLASIKEIAERTGSSESRVKVLLHRERKAKTDGREDERAEVLFLSEGTGFFT